MQKEYLYLVILYGSKIVLLQKIEFYETKDFQYLLIPKNGSMSVLKSFEKIPHIVTRELANKVKWTVIRNPIDRLISGLAYDLNLQKLSLKDIDIKSLFYSNMHSVIKEFHYVSHTSLQIYYLFNAKINWYINIEDLDIFLKMHFSKQNRINKGINKLKEEIKRYVYDNMETIEPYLTTDIKMYETIQQSEQLWQWQKGRIFNETN
jgi:hypothetical protein